MSDPKHIVIVGAGPGGYVAAIRAAQLGAQVSVVEHQALGGVCLNWGCIPSKALLSVIEVGEKAKKAVDCGLTLGGAVGYDLAKMVARKNSVVDSLVKGIGMLFKTWGIQHVHGWGSLVDARTVRVAQENGAESQLSADGIILATGSSWPDLPMFPVDGRQILTSKDALDLTEVPDSILIVGGGVEGCEFASLFSGLGAQVTIVELLPRVLPLEDEEVSSMMAREFKKNKIEVLTGTKVAALNRDGTGIQAVLDNGTEVRAQKILVSVGRGFHSKDIGLEQVGVQLGDRGDILVNDHMETTVPGVYAIGDVVGKAMLAHVASAQGKVAVENILGRSRAVNYQVIPAGIFTLPEIGRVGLTEGQAKEQVAQAGNTPDDVLKIGRFRYAGIGKAQAVGETTGFMKVISEAGTGTILGVHMVGSHAADLIHEAALAMHTNTPVAHLADMIHAHPTLAEGLMEAAEDVEGMAIHLARKRAK